DFTFTAFTQADGTVAVCERQGMKPLAILPGEGTPVNGILHFSLDARWLAAGYCTQGAEQGRVIVWDWRNSRPVLRLAGVTRSALDFWPDGSRLVACIGDELHFYRLPDGVEDRPLAQLPGRALTVRVSPNGRRIAASLVDSSHLVGGVVVLETEGPSS